MRSHVSTVGPKSLWPVGETEYVARVASGAVDPNGRRIAAGIVGRADLTAADIESVIEAHVTAGRGLFRGVRQSLAYHPNPTAHGTTANPRPDLMRDPSFRRGMMLLGKRGLSFDAFLYHTQLPDLLSVAQACPGTTIVIDHAGSPLGIGPFAGKRHEVFSACRKSIRELALAPNAHIKFGGLGMRLTGMTMHLREEPPSSQDLADLWAPYVHA